MNQRQAGSTNFPINFFMVLSTDHVTPATGKSVSVTLSKNGGPFGPASGAVTEIGNGWYSLAGHASDRSTVGELVLRGAASGCDDTPGKYVIVPWDPFDVMRLGLTSLPNAAPATNGGLPTVDGSNRIAGIQGTVNNLNNLNMSLSAVYADMIRRTDTFAVQPDAGNSPASVKTNLPATDDGHYLNYLARVTSGTYAGRVARIAAYIGATKLIVFEADDAMPATLANGVTVDLYPIAGLTSSSVLNAISSTGNPIWVGTNGGVDLEPTGTYGALLDELNGLLGKNVGMRDTVYTDGNLTSYKLFLYDTAANAATNNGVTGVQHQYDVTKTYAGRNLLTSVTRKIS